MDSPCFTSSTSPERRPSSAPHAAAGAADSTAPHADVTSAASTRNGSLAALRSPGTMECDDVAASAGSYDGGSFHTAVDASPNPAVALSPRRSMSTAAVSPVRAGSLSLGSFGGRHSLLELHSRLPAPARRAADLVNDGEDDEGDDDDNRLAASSGAECDAPHFRASHRRVSGEGIPTAPPAAGHDEATDLSHGDGPHASPAIGYIPALPPPRQRSPGPYPTATANWPEHAIPTLATSTRREQQPPSLLDGSTSRPTVLSGALRQPDASVTTVSSTTLSGEYAYAESAIVPSALPPRRRFGPDAGNADLTAGGGDHTTADGVSPSDLEFELDDDEAAVRAAEAAGKQLSVLHRAYIAALPPANDDKADALIGHKFLIDDLPWGEEELAVPLVRKCFQPFTKYAAPAAEASYQRFMYRRGQLFNLQSCLLASLAFAAVIIQDTTPRMNLTNFALFAGAGLAIFLGFVACGALEILWRRAVGTLQDALARHRESQVAVPPWSPNVRTPPVTQRRVSPDSTLPTRVAGLSAAALADSLTNAPALSTDGMPAHARAQFILSDSAIASSHKFVTFFSWGLWCVLFISFQSTRVSSCTLHVRGAPEDEVCRVAMGIAHTLGLGVSTLFNHFPIYTAITHVSALGALCFLQLYVYRDDFDPRADTFPRAIMCASFSVMLFFLACIRDAANRQHFSSLIECHVAGRELANRHAEFAAVLGALLPVPLARRAARIPRRAAAGSQPYAPLFRGLQDASPNATVAITEAVDFTDFELSFPQARIALAGLSHLFTLFDVGSQVFRVDRGTTFGDAYVVTVNLVAGSRGNVLDVARFCLWQLGLDESQMLPLRSCITSGSASAGIVGSEKALRYNVSGPAVEDSWRTIKAVPQSHAWVCSATRGYIGELNGRCGEDLTPRREPVGPTRAYSRVTLTDVLPDDLLCPSPPGSAGGSYPVVFAPGTVRRGESPAASSASGGPYAPPPAIPYPAHLSGSQHYSRDLDLLARATLRDRRNERLYGVRPMTSSTLQHVMSSNNNSGSLVTRSPKPANVVVGGNSTAAHSTIDGALAPPQTWPNSNPSPTRPPRSDSRPGSRLSTPSTAPTGRARAVLEVIEVMDASAEMAAAGLPQPQGGGAPPSLTPPPPRSPTATQVVSLVSVAESDADDEEVPDAVLVEIASGRFVDDATEQRYCQRDRSRPMAYSAFYMAVVCSYGIFVPVLGTRGATGDREVVWVDWYPIPIAATLGSFVACGISFCRLTSRPTAYSSALMLLATMCNTATWWLAPRSPFFQGPTSLIFLLAPILEGIVFVDLPWKLTGLTVNLVLNWPICLLHNWSAVGGVTAVAVTILIFITSLALATSTRATWAAADASRGRLTSVSAVTTSLAGLAHDLIPRHAVQRGVQQAGVAAIRHRIFHTPGGGQAMYDATADLEEVEAKLNSLAGVLRGDHGDVMIDFHEWLVAASITVVTLVPSQWEDRSPLADIWNMVDECLEQVNRELTERHRGHIVNAQQHHSGVGGSNTASEAMGGPSPHGSPASHPHSPIGSPGLFGLRTPSTLRGRGSAQDLGVLNPLDPITVHAADLRIGSSREGNFASASGAPAVVTRKNAHSRFPASAAQLRVVGSLVDTILLAGPLDGCGDYKCASSAAACVRFATLLHSRLDGSGLGLACAFVAEEGTGALLGRGTMRYGVQGAAMRQVKELGAAVALIRAHAAKDTAAATPHFMRLYEASGVGHLPKTAATAENAWLLKHHGCCRPTIWTLETGGNVSADDAPHETAL
jgi:hypothetical protein